MSKIRDNKQSTGMKFRSLAAVELHFPYYYWLARQIRTNLLGTSGENKIITFGEENGTGLWRTRERKDETAGEAGALTTN